MRLSLHKRMLARTVIPTGVVLLALGLLPSAAWGGNFPQAAADSASLLSVGQIVSSIFEDAYQPPLLAGAAKGLGTSARVHMPATDAQWIDDTVVSDMLFPATFAPEGLGAFDPPLGARTGLSTWRLPTPPALFSLWPDQLAGQSGGSVDDPGQGLDTPDVSASAPPVPSALQRDWGGLGRDTVVFLGFQLVVIGITYLLPEDVSRWSEEQKDVTIERWWDNVQNPTWDEDKWAINYIGHPYFGATYYIRARERGFGAFGAFWYAAFLSSLYEFGVEALFEQPSYQDLIVTPVAGALLGALVFEPLRTRIKRKAERQWYDHLALILTDPLGVGSGLLERALGIKAEVRVQFRPPALTPYESVNARPAPRSQGASIEFVFNGKEKSARRDQ